MLVSEARRGILVGLNGFVLWGKRRATDCENRESGEASAGGCRRRVWWVRRWLLCGRKCVSDAGMRIAGFVLTLFDLAERLQGGCIGEREAAARWAARGRASGMRGSVSGCTNSN